MSQDRLSSLISFAQTQGLDIQANSQALYALNGDASFRRYYRFTLNEQAYKELLNHHNLTLSKVRFCGSVILVDAPPSSQKNYEFARINQLLKQSGVVVSQIIASDFEQGFFILEDLGQTMFCDIAKGDEQTQYYYQAIVELAKIASMPFNADDINKLNTCRELAIKKGHGEEDLIPIYHFDANSFANMELLPHFDDDFIRMELGICEEWLFEKTLKLELDKQEQAMLKDSFDFLVKGCLAQRQIAMHRDYHCRNIMQCDLQNPIDKGLAVIDYQDMVKGPLGYDVASILYDCYTKLSDAQREKLLAFTYAVYCVCGLIDDQSCSIADFAHQVKICALQRHIKVLGLFNRLNLRDGKSSYLKDLPLVLEYILENCNDFNELRPFQNFLRTKIQDKL